MRQHLALIRLGSTYATSISSATSGKQRQTTILNNAFGCGIKLHTKVVYLWIKRLNHYSTLLTQNIAHPTQHMIVWLFCRNITHTSATTAPRRLKHTCAITQHYSQYISLCLAITTLAYNFTIGVVQDRKQMLGGKTSVAKLSHNIYGSIIWHESLQTAVGTQQLFFYGAIPSPWHNMYMHIIR